VGPRKNLEQANPSPEEPKVLVRAKKVKPNKREGFQKSQGQKRGRRSNRTLRKRKRVGKRP